MPGMELNFRCPCGFIRKGVLVGAALDGHYQVVMCLNCHLLLSVWRDEGKFKEQQALSICEKCGKPLMPITASGAWGPADFQNKFPNLEPWIVGNGDNLDEELTDEERAQFAQIRFCVQSVGHSSLSMRR